MAAGQGEPESQQGSVSCFARAPSLPYGGQAGISMLYGLGSRWNQAMA